MASQAEIRENIRRVFNKLSKSEYNQIVDLVNKELSLNSTNFLR